MPQGEIIEVIISTLKPYATARTVLGIVPSCDEPINNQTVVQVVMIPLVKDVPDVQILNHTIRMRFGRFVLRTQPQVVIPDSVAPYTSLRAKLQ